MERCKTTLQFNIPWWVILHNAEEPIWSFTKRKSLVLPRCPQLQAAEATDAIPTPVAQGGHREPAKTQMLWKPVRSFDGDVPGFTQ